MQYKIIWEVSKYALVDADSPEQAIEKFHEGGLEEFEKEITMSPEAYENS